MIFFLKIISMISRFQKWFFHGCQVTGTCQKLTKRNLQLKKNPSRSIVHQWSIYVIFLFKSKSPPGPWTYFVFSFPSHMAFVKSQPALPGGRWRTFFSLFMVFMCLYGFQKISLAQKKMSVSLWPTFHLCCTSFFFCSLAHLPFLSALRRDK